MSPFVPEGCYAKAGLARALNLGTVRLQMLAKDDSFPEPDGYYQSQNGNRRTFPYWNIQRVRDWLDVNDIEIKVIPKTDKPYEYLEDQPGWAVPAYDRNESLVSIKTRVFINLMRVSL